MTSDLRIPKINEHDEVVGETTIPEAVQNGWPRRVARVQLFDGEGNILLQRRSDTIIGYPGRWDNSAAGHVDVGETYEAAAKRELFEELGLECALTQVVHSFRNLDTFDCMFVATIASETPVVTCAKEVAEVAWVSVADFEKDMQTYPEKYVPPFLHVYKTFRAKLLP